MATPSYNDILEKDILELLDLQDLPKDKKDELYTKLYNTVENRTILRLDAVLSDEDFAEWKKILGSGERERAQEFLKSKGFDSQRIMLEETAILKAQLVFMVEEEGKQGDSSASGQAASASAGV